MDRETARSMNAEQVERVLGAPADPIPEGGYALRVLRSRGRRSGAARDTPLGVVRHHDALYLVSPRASRDWVRNLAAAPDCETAAGGERERHRAVVPDGPEAAGAVAVYLRSVRAPWALRAFPVAPEASEAEIGEHLGEMAVLRLDPR